MDANLAKPPRALCGRRCLMMFHARSQYETSPFMPQPLPSWLATGAGGRRHRPLEAPTGILPPAGAGTDQRQMAFSYHPASRAARPAAGDAFVLRKALCRPVPCRGRSRTIGAPPAPGRGSTAPRCSGRVGPGTGKAPREASDQRGQELECSRPHAYDLSRAGGCAGRGRPQARGPPAAVKDPGPRPGHARRHRWATGTPRSRAPPCR